MKELGPGLKDKKILMISFLNDHNEYCFIDCIFPLGKISEHTEARLHTACLRVICCKDSKEWLNHLPTSVFLTNNSF